MLLLSQRSAGRASYQAHEAEPVVRAPLTMNAPPDWHAVYRVDIVPIGGASA
jgi:hypothetical protein